MKSLLAGLGALTVMCTGALAAGDVEYPLSYETCGDICRLQRYIDSDHMVTLVPAPAPAVLPESRRGTVRPRTIRRALALVRPAAALHRGSVAIRGAPPAKPQASAMRAEPAPDTAALAPTPSPPVAAPAIPGSAAVVTAGFEFR